MNIAENIRRIRNEVPAKVEIVAVSKFHPAEMILEAYEAGQRIFGESRVQEFLLKQETLPQDIRWHFIGHLQTNKVKAIIGKTAMIESVDSLRLLELINKESEKTGVITDLLLQVHVAKEETKFGFYPEEIREIFNKGIYHSFRSIRMRGLMGMASNVDDEERIRSDFMTIHQLYEEIKNNQDLETKHFDCLSMGMSGDWRLAVDEGSNIVRIGSSIFGSRT